VGKVTFFKPRVSKMISNQTIGRVCLGCHHVIWRPCKRVTNGSYFC